MLLLLQCTTITTKTMHHLLFSGCQSRCRFGLILFGNVELVELGLEYLLADVQVGVLATSKC
jgi:hypothetical protein